MKILFEQVILPTLRYISYEVQDAFILHSTPLCRDPIHALEALDARLRIGHCLMVALVALRPRSARLESTTAFGSLLQGPSTAGVGAVIILARGWPAVGAEWVAVSSRPEG